MENAFSFSFTEKDGSELKLSDFDGKVLLVVNTASQCGFVYQLEELQQLYVKYKDRGLEIIAVPSNDFGGQEPNDDEAIRQYCNSNFEFTYHLVNKEMIKGENNHPFYKWAATQVSIFGLPKWNFHKYLVGRDGNIKEWFFSMTSPLSTNVESAIERELNQTKLRQ